MAAKKRGSGKRKSASSTAAAVTATSSAPETDELFVPKGSAAATTATKTKSKSKTKEKTKTKAPRKDASDSSSNDNDNDNDDDGDDDDDDVVELKVNEKFAKAFQDQKRKEELTRLERQRKLYGDDNGDDASDDSESETEDEDGEQLTHALDADIRKTLQLIRKKDPAIYDQSIAFFEKTEATDSDSDTDDDGTKRKQKSSAKKDAPLYYKDLVRQQVIAGDVDSEDDADKRDGGDAGVMTYGEEQAKLKRDFLASLKQSAVDSDDDDDDGEASSKPAKPAKPANDGDDEDGDDALDGGLFTIRKKTVDEAQAEAAEYAAFQTTKDGKALAKTTTDVDPDAFLEHYLSSEGWKDKRAAVPHYDDIVKDDDGSDIDDSADELERAEAFEHSYNFRFEEAGSGVIATHARHVDDTLRREDDSRKRKRAERKERKALERLQKEEELRRLKNLKQAELESKLAKVAKLMGATDSTEASAALKLKLKLTAQDIDGAFDPDEYDQRMREVFDEAYYNDADDAAVLEKPVWDDDEDRALFADLPGGDSDDEADAEGDAEVEADGSDDEDDEAAAVNIVEPEDDDVEDDEDANDADDDPLSADKVAGMSATELARAKQQYLDELYALDYEDLIGDLKCRFKYRSVPTNDFGLTVDEIMAADDKELKALVSLKRLAPYADSEFHVDRKRVKQFKKSLAEVERERQAKRDKKKQKQLDAGDGDAEDVDAAAVPTDAAAGGKKRKRAKKTKAAAAAADSETVVTDSATVDTSKKHKKSRDADTKEDETVDASAVETAASKIEEPVAVAIDSKSDSKKKQRRSKKKSDGGAASALKATGLSTSRLESYKLTKAASSKKKTTQHK